VSDARGCWERLTRLAERGSDDPRKAASKIVEAFGAGAANDELEKLRDRLELERVSGMATGVKLSQLRAHSYWLAVVEGARLAANAS
jgi:hypothetical protein